MVEQCIHARVWLKMECKELFCSFVYAHNKYTHRYALWKSLCVYKLYARNRPWCILGDFNAAIFLEDSSAGSSIDISILKDGLLKKIDRIMANLEFGDGFVGAHAVFKPYRISDHAPSVLTIPIISKQNPKPFIFFNIIARSDKFKEVVKEGWNEQVSGFCMFKVVKRLKLLKKPLRKLLYEKGNLHDNVKRLCDELDRVQTNLDANPFNVSLPESEATCVAAFNEALIMEEHFLKQKAKIDWLCEGDTNSAYFFKAVKSQVSRSRIDVVTGADGTIFVNNNVPDAFVSHYEQSLGLPGATSGFNTVNLFKTHLHENQAVEMI
ncbi:RNA-directed DNA polymerase, eukaryota, reverse transcriptase zinc-binding domain protein [Tanacetum coccineum]